MEKIFAINHERLAIIAYILSHLEENITAVKMVEHFKLSAPTIKNILFDCMHAGLLFHEVIGRNDVFRVNKNYVHMEDIQKVCSIFSPQPQTQV